jgi:hypothetical protein
VTLDAIDEDTAGDSLVPARACDVAPTVAEPNSLAEAKVIIEAWGNTSTLSGHTHRSDSDHRHRRLLSGPAHHAGSHQWPKSRSFTKIATGPPL